jgi:hypothetical protein
MSDQPGVARGCAVTLLYTFAAAFFMAAFFMFMIVFGMMLKPGGIYGMFSWFLVFYVVLFLVLLLFAIALIRVANDIVAPPDAS